MLVAMAMSEELASQLYASVAALALAVAAYLPRRRAALAAGRDPAGDGA